MSAAIDEIVSNFDLLEEWEDKYRYLIELGRSMPALPEDAHTEANKVKGCASQVWLETRFERADGTTRLHLRGDSDAHIVRGLVALVVALYSGRPAAEAANIDATVLFAKLGLSEHLTPQRSNGVRAMVERIRSDARSAAA